MTNERLEKLGNYFVFFNIHQRYQVTFEQFVRMVDMGRWAEFCCEYDFPSLRTGLFVDCRV